MTQAETQQKALRLFKALDDLLTDTDHGLTYTYSIGKDAKFSSNARGISVEDMTCCMAMSIYAQARIFIDSGLEPKHFADVIEEAVRMAYAVIKGREEEKGKIIVGPWAEKMGDRIVRDGG